MEQPRRSKRLKQKQSQNPTGLTFNADKGHPLLNGLILENVFKHFKGQNSATLLANFRVVSKLWDQEITKLIRKDTQIDLTHLLNPYPNGMGWTASAKAAEEPFHYKTPYTEVRSFENVLVTANSCEHLKCANWIKWFQVMGSQVKRLQFSSPFTCFCQNHFFERILKEWCPNLEYLEIRGVKSVDSLLLMSSFEQKSANFICKGLKELRVFFDGAEESYSLCTDKDTTYNTVHVLDINIRKLCLKFSNWKVINFIYEYGRDTSNEMTFPEIVSTAGKKVTLPVRLVKYQGIPDLSEYFTNHLSPTDGGIVGQIMKEISVEKFVIHGLDELHQCQDLVTFFHIRPNKWRSSLKELDLGKFVSKSVKLLHVIAQLKFPLTRIRLGGVHSNEDNEEMTRFLSCFGDTLEHLEFSGSSLKEESLEESSELSLPSLPKLKTFVHENIVASCLSAVNLWRNAPNLESCIVTGTSGNWNAERFFENSESISIKAMKDLKLATQISEAQGEMILNWFPNLIKLEVGFESLGTEAYRFHGKLGKSKVEQLKIDILGYANQNANVRGIRLWKRGNIEGLKSLELKNMTGLPLRLSPKLFSNGNLTSLKLNNFHILKNEEKNFLSSLSHIPSVQLVNGVLVEEQNVT